MNTIFKIAIIFLAITGASTILMNTSGLGLEFKYSNFWQNHGVFFLFFITLFPRLTLLFSNVAFGGIFWWLGFFFAPRILVAVLATLSYWENNPVLVVISWLIAISGETGEKSVLNTQIRVVKSGKKPFTRESFSGGETIEAEFREIND